MPSARLSSACQNGDLEQMRRVLQDEPDAVNYRCPVWAPLHVLIQNHDSPNGVALLLDNNADINLRCGQGQTPLMTAGSSRRPCCARVLLEHGADPMLKDRDNMDAMDWAMTELPWVRHASDLNLSNEVTSILHAGINRWPETKAKLQLQLQRKQGGQGDRVTTNHQVLYHATDEAAAQAILTSQQMVRGSAGAAGGGIYFAASPADARRKARTTGSVVLKARVALGSSKVLSQTDPNISFTSLQREGCDSVRLTALHGDEFIVYNWDQVRQIERV